MSAFDNLAIEVLFAPWDDCTGRYMEFVKSAEREIVISIYGLHMPPLIDLLIAKFQAGLRVSVILDHTQAAGRAESGDVERLVAAKVPHLVGTSPIHRQILHSKFTVVDGGAVECGSWNYSLSASQQLNDLHLVHSPALALAYLQRFERIRDFILLHEMAMQAIGTVAAVAPDEVPDGSASPSPSPSDPTTPAPKKKGAAA